MRLSFVAAFIFVQTSFVFASTIPQSSILTHRRQQLQHIPKIIAAMQAQLSPRKMAVPKNTDPSPTSSLLHDLKRESNARIDDQMTLLKRNRQAIAEDLIKWQKEYAVLLTTFKRAKQKYLHNVVKLKKDLILFRESTDAKMLRRIDSRSTITIKAAPHLIAGAFSFPITRQQHRPTCAAFAGIRAVEILLSQHQRHQALSPQYFYWASKPSCQKVACKKRGSWVTKGFNRSLNYNGFDIPTLRDCPYNGTKRPNNETQIPLEKNCSKGVVKIIAHQNVVATNAVVEALNAGKPIIGAFRLSANFYHNNGIVRLHASVKKRKLDLHAAGHALLIVGYLPLPQPLTNEGRFCFVVANSWGTGWGLGGYGCLTEAWFRRYRFRTPFVSLEQVAIQ